ncbi:right-handed parallel beta-helix repeat-containing protein [Streptomyces sp. NPDC006335]|uniref:right-handed parallel beta-helix repeat-containing protein n=1 Tax=Streptomyces sp. NPDC006335 TaxID=3156895 RepID=UPI0033A7B824
MRTDRIRPAVPDRFRTWLAATSLIGASAAAVLVPAGSAFAVGTTLHASPSGSGTACSASRPCSLTQAKTTVRAINHSMKADITVELADGVHRLSAPLTFTSADSGTGGHTVTWKAAPFAHPVISGAKKVTGWTVQDSTKNIWKASVGKGIDTRQLFVDGLLATRARTAVPRSSLTPTTTGYTFTSSSLSNLNSLADPGRVEVEGADSFTNRYSPVAGISNNVITMEQPAWNNNTFGYDTITSPYQDTAFSLENAYEFLDTAGEWNLDPTTGTLYYKPLPGQTMSSADVELPRLESLLDIGGTYAKPAHDLAFSGIQFSHTSWLQPSGPQGYASQQTGAFIHGSWDRPSDALASCQSGCKLFEATRPHWHQMPAAVQVSAAHDVAFTGDRFTQLGQVAVGIGNDANAHTSGVGLGADTVSVTGSVFTQNAGGGVAVGGVQADAHHPSDRRMTNQNITVSNNVFHDIALDYRDMSAVLATYVSTIGITHNEIYNMPYSGITIGYGWGSNDPGGSPDYQNRGLYDYQPVYTTPTTAKNNHIDGNYIHDVMQSMNDGACMYTLSDSPGSTLDGNYCTINDNYFGLYFDEGSRHYSASGNVFRQTGTWAHENNQGGNYTGALTLTGNWTSNTGTDVFDGQRGNTVTGTVNVTDGNWPSGARAAMAAAGVQPAYRAMTPGPVTTPYSTYSSVPADIGQSGTTLTLTDTGKDIWAKRDSYSTAYMKKAATSGTTITARVDHLDATDPWAKAGVVLRNNLRGSASSAGYAVMVSTPGHGVAFQYDSNGDGRLDKRATVSGTPAAVRVRLTRTGNLVSGFYSTDGTTFTQVGHTVALAKAATDQDAGVIHTANSSTVGSAVLSDLTITTSPYKAYSSIPAALVDRGGSYSLTGAGVDTWAYGTQYDDEYGAIYRPAAFAGGDTVTVRVDSQKSGSGWSKAGIMIRNSVSGTGSSPGYAVLALTPGNGVTLQWDSNSDGYLNQYTSAAATTTAPVWLRLTRDGTTLTGSYSTDGASWTAMPTTAALTGAAATQDAGMFFTAHSGVAGTADMSHFTIT